MTSLVERLVGLGAEYDNQPAPQEIYPEANTSLEADLLACLAQATSAKAIDLLLAQPALWKKWIGDIGEDQAKHTQEPFQQILTRSDALDHLTHAPAVVVVGRPNVGKSTLTNRMLGRSASLVADLPGTTRDWVAGLAELDGVAVRWMDTPGLRTSEDQIEQHAIELAGQAIKQADVVMAMRDPENDWPDDSALGLAPDLWVINKIDQAAGKTPDRTGHRDAQLAISAKTGRGIDPLRQRVLACLGLEGQMLPGLWAFSKTLRSAIESGELSPLVAYIHGV